MKGKICHFLHVLQSICSSPIISLSKLTSVPRGKFTEGPAKIGIGETGKPPGSWNGPIKLAAPGKGGSGCIKVASVVRRECYLQCRSVTQLVAYIYVIYSVCFVWIWYLTICVQECIIFHCYMYRWHYNGNVLVFAVGCYMNIASLARHV